MHNIFLTNYCRLLKYICSVLQAVGTWKNRRDRVYLVRKRRTLFLDQLFTVQHNN